MIGDSRGIGAEVRDQLLAAGHQVIGISRTGATAGGNYTSITQDVVAEPIDLSEYTDQLDGLVYCPGTINLKPFSSLKPEDVLNDLQVNYIGDFQNIQKNFRLLRKGNDPAVVLFSTVAVKNGMAFHSSISGAKAAVEGLTKSLAAEFAPKIRVNAVAPSLTDTSLAEALLNNEKKQESAKDRHPMKRFGEAADVARVASFLVGDESSWMTGQIIGVDGGLSTLKV